MKKTQELIRAFAKSRAAASLGAAFFLGCSGPTPPELAREGAAPSAEETRQESNDNDAKDAKLPRVVGYLPTYRLGETRLDLKTLTHLIITFANPNRDGEVVFPDGFHDAITKVVSAAHAPNINVKVLVALAGGDDRTTKPALQRERGVPRYIESVMRLVRAYDLDGVDVDIEGDEIDPATYEPLMRGLAETLRSEEKPKLLTAAVGSWRSENYRALDTVDFLNVMSYDHCEPPAHECNHATLDQAERDLATWANLRQPDENGAAPGPGKVVLGIPFYGRCWGEACPHTDRLADGTYASNLTHQEIVDRCADRTFTCPTSPSDTITNGKGASGYYVSLNSSPTIRAKTQLAKRYGGLMIWELGQDDSNGSLFAEVHNAFSKPDNQGSTSTVEAPSR